MRKILLFAVLIIVSAAQFVNAQVNGTAAKPLVSTTDKPVYYYIESAANGTVVFSASVNNNLLGNLLYVPTYTTLPTNLKYDLKANIANADNALWQMVNEGGVVKLKNKGTGLVMVDSRNGNTDNTNNFLAEALNAQYAANSQYRLRNSNQTSPGVAWYSTANGNYLDRWGSMASNSQVAWFFLVAPGSEANYQDLYVSSVKSDLTVKITAMQTVLDNTSEGTDPGKFTADARTALTDAKNTAQAIYDNVSSTVENYLTAITDLETAKWTYLSSAIKPVISDATATRWYFLQGLRPANSYMTSTGSKAPILGKTVIPDDTQLWKFVANTKGTANGFAIVNKATGEYLSANTPYNTAINSTDTIPANNLQFIASDIFTNNTVRFWIENASGSTPAFRLHAGNSSILNWNGNAYDNSSWLILDYTATLKALLQTSLTNAQNSLAVSVEGTDFGQYAAADRSNLQTAITTAQGVYDNAAAIDSQIMDAATALNAAIETYKTTINSNPVSLLSSDAKKYRWYWIRSYATNANAAYCFGKVISAATRTIGAKYTYEEKAASFSDGQLFRFELTTDQTKVLNIIDKMGNYMAADGTIATGSTAGNDFTLTPLTDGIAFWIKPTSLDPIHAQQTNADIVNWNNTAGSASAWVFDFALESLKVPTANAEVSTTNYIVRSNNGIITVDGVDNFEVYSVTGQKQNINSRLQAGAYLVKINKSNTLKVMVK